MRGGLLLFTLLLCACSREPRFSPLPAQVPAVEAPDPPESPCFFSMSDPRADLAIVRDIPGGPSAGWQRWTAARPAVKCRIPSPGPWQAAMDLLVSGATFKDTGPLTITFTVNAREIGRLRCEKEGEYRFRAPVPPDLALPGAELTLEASVDKPWVSPTDGAKLGFLLSAAGFLIP
jgi:hypothetical protein